MSKLSSATIGFLGAGNMGEAIIRGLLDRDALPAGQIHATDASPERRADMAARFPIRIVESNLELVANSSVILFAVKPQIMPQVMEEVRVGFAPEKLSISICAGTPTGAIETGLRSDIHPEPRVVRVMPNTPALIGAGLAGLCRGAHATADDLALAREIFEAVGETVEVGEEQMDAVTALTGSGPAYVFRLIEALVAGGVKHGFPEEQATKMVLQMVLGAARLAKESDKTPEQLRIAVTSPGGTTAAGLKALDEKGFWDAVIACVDAAEARGKELGRGG